MQECYSGSTRFAGCVVDQNVVAYFGAHLGSVADFSCVAILVPVDIALRGTLVCCGFSLGLLWAFLLHALRRSPSGGSGD